MCLWSDSNYKEKLAARRTQETLLGIPGSKSRCLPIIPSSLYQLWEYVCMDSMGQVLPTQKWQNPLTSPSGPVARLHHWGRLRISPCQWSTCTLPWRMGESTNLKLLILLWLAPLLMKLWNAHDKRTICFSRFERNARKLQECQDRPHYAPQSSAEISEIWEMSPGVCLKHHFHPQLAGYHGIPKWNLPPIPIPIPPIQIWEHTNPHWHVHDFGVL